jgi:prepilin peptidase CpaA
MPNILKFVLVGLVVTAAIFDFRSRRIPNWLNLSGLILGLGLNTLLFAQHGLWIASLGALLPLALYVPLYLLRAMGAADAKLMVAVGSITGPHNWIGILVCTALSGGLLAIVVAAAKGRLHRTLANMIVLAGELTRFRSPATRHEALDVKNNRSMRLPHGVTIAAGSLAFVLLNPVVLP